MIEQMLFWPLSELMRLAHVFHFIDNPEDIDTDDTSGFNVGITITLGSIIIGLIVGIIIGLPSPSMIAATWLIWYIVGAVIELLFSGWQWGWTWWIRTFLDGLVIGLTLRSLVLPG